MSLEISIVLSTYNALERLKNCLYSLTLQDVPLSKFEVIVVDDCSTDQTEEYMRSLISPYPITYEKNEKNLGRSSTRNKGIRLARGKILIFCDCDMILPPEFVRNHLNYHEQNDWLVVCGSFWHQISTHPPLTFESIKNKHYLHHVTEQPWAYWFKQFVYKYGRNLTSFYFPWMYFVVMNVSVRKKHVTEVGGFDESFQGYGGEDEELGFRLYKRGLHFVMDQHLKNYHQEHPRAVNQHDESQSNIDYILKKHQSIDTLLFYRINEYNHFYKNAVLQEIYRLPSSKENKDFLDMLVMMLTNASIQKNETFKKDFVERFQSINRQNYCPHLTMMIRKWLKKQRRRRFT
ncbi:glycosyltransferase [Bacillus sp. NEB1478]|uniref:glycosyltransferase family 2 protein n=1 Tax=Bacillus sp. NEB1478 TaxID=3073816 RepID=UPI002873A1C8|nr:glycosyltransferase [Bacillus sp. NEB1478]WNB90297.1 glycosyltransferase [Bacillus sp. NEB1478]